MSIFESIFMSFLSLDLTCLNNDVTLLTTPPTDDFLLWEFPLFFTDTELPVFDFILASLAFVETGNILLGHG